MQRAFQLTLGLLLPEPLLGAGFNFLLGSFPGAMRSFGDRCGVGFCSDCGYAIVFAFAQSTLNARSTSDIIPLGARNFVAHRNHRNTALWTMANRRSDGILVRLLENLSAAKTGVLTKAIRTMLIGDRSGPAIIAHTYGDVRSDHLLAQAQRIRLTVDSQTESSIKSSNTVLPVSGSFNK